MKPISLKIENNQFPEDFLFHLYVLIVALWPYPQEAHFFLILWNEAFPHRLQRRWFLFPLFLPMLAVPLVMLLPQ